MHTQLVSIEFQHITGPFTQKMFIIMSTTPLPRTAPTKKNGYHPGRVLDDTRLCYARADYSANNSGPYVNAKLPTCQSDPRFAPGASDRFGVFPSTRTCMWGFPNGPAAIIDSSKTARNRCHTTARGDPDQINYRYRSRIQDGVFGITLLRGPEEPDKHPFVLTGQLSRLVVADRRHFAIRQLYTWPKDKYPGLLYPRCQSRAQTVNQSSLLANIRGFQTAYYYSRGTELSWFWDNAASGQAHLEWRWKTWSPSA
ncbi:hypothetical protein FB45DRAFT_1004182 [Roridomyces roridus]|uniref:Uncharacterized protein n=1 Tax=Roridomyces roridus TaxID=1738132 RepID=A0AAD7FK17_9AGAR|nr:hypothetical protein FB45DRAFT_1004182 [Roridomyces roridus]